MLRHRELRGLASVRPLGVLTASDRLRDRLHRLRCAECRRLALRSRETAARVLEAVPEVPATPALRARVLASVAQRRVADRDRRRVLVLAGATAVATAGAAFWLRGGPTDPGRVERIELVGGPAAPGARATLTWPRGGSDAELIVRGLARAAPGASYQLWKIRSGAPESVLVFEVDLSTSDPIRFLLVGGPRGDTYAVSVEPRGGSTQPTGPIVLASR